jgi:hypothetical protein
VSYASTRQAFPNQPRNIATFDPITNNRLDSRDHRPHLLKTGCSHLSDHTLDLDRRVWWMAASQAVLMTLPPLGTSPKPTGRNPG